MSNSGNGGGRPEATAARARGTARRTAFGTALPVATVTVAAAIVTGIASPGTAGPGAAHAAMARSLSRVTGVKAHIDAGGHVGSDAGAGASAGGGSGAGAGAGAGAGSGASTGAGLKPGTVHAPADLGYARSPWPYERYAFSRATGLLSVYSPEERARFPCTASVVRSASRSIVVTAAHCARPLGPAHHYYTRMTFTPAYSAQADPRNGRNHGVRAPYGVWHVRKAWVSRAWRRSGLNMEKPKPPNRFSMNDVAVLSVAPDRHGRRLQDVVGGFRPLLSERASFRGITTLGYPYDAALGLYGNLLYQCGGGAAPASPWIGPGALQTNDCWVRSGHSGGPWVSGSGTGATILGVTSANMSRPGSLAARLRPETFGTIFKRAERWTRRHHPAHPRARG